MSRGAAPACASPLLVLIGDRKPENATVGEVSCIRYTLTDLANGMTVTSSLSARAMMVGVQELRRITMDPEVMGGKPCVRGMRVTVGMIVEALAAGRTIQDLLTDFPYLQEPDIREALAFAAWLAQGHDVWLGS